MDLLIGQVACTLCDYQIAWNLQIIWMISGGDLMSEDKILAPMLQTFPGILEKGSMFWKVISKQNTQKCISHWKIWVFHRMSKKSIRIPPFWRSWLFFTPCAGLLFFGGRSGGGNQVCQYLPPTLLPDLSPPVTSGFSQS